MLTLAALPWAAAHRDPEAPLLRLGAATLTASALDRAAAGVAARLEREGAGDGDRQQERRVDLQCWRSAAGPEHQQ